MGARISGLAELQLMLNQIGKEATQAARRQMKAEAQKIMLLARANAPVDEKRLEESIGVDEDRGGANYRKRFYVVVGGTVRGRNVDEYALIMHESRYKLGKASLAKAAANVGSVVGPKYLERAYDERLPHITNALIQAVGKVLR